MFDRVAKPLVLPFIDSTFLRRYAFLDKNQSIRSLNMKTKNKKQPRKNNDTHRTDGQKIKKDYTENYDLQYYCYICMPIYCNKPTRWNGFCAVPRQRSFLYRTDKYIHSDRINTKKLAPRTIKKVKQNNSPHCNNKLDSIYRGSTKRTKL